MLRVEPPSFPLIDARQAKGLGVPMLSHKEAVELIQYDPIDGTFRWLKSKNRKLKEGKIAGSINGSGYVLIHINGITYRAHRLAWLLVNGSWPDRHIDHINNDKADNRWSNLRECTRSENLRNVATRKDSSTGLKGVSFDKSAAAYRARIQVDGNRILLGYFSCAEDAYRAYVAAAKEMHGKFSRLS